MERDLLFSTGRELRDVGGALSWGALGAFVHNLAPDSATAAELNPELAQWSTRLQTNMLLADLLDVLRQFNANVCGAFGGKRPEAVKPYPRPWVRDKDSTTRHIGSDGLPPAQLRAWFARKRREARHK